MKRSTKLLVAATLALSLTVVPLAACSGQSSSGDAGSGGQTEAAAVDVSTIKTLADGLEGGTATTTGWDENYVCCVTDVDGTYIRMVAKSSQEINDKIAELDLMEDEDNSILIGAVGDLPVISAENISEQIPPQEELDALAGKTGKDLYADGYTFGSYSVYGEGNTVACLEKGNCAFDVTFEETLDEAGAEDEGESLNSMTVKSIEFTGASNAATDPTLVMEQK